MNARIKDVPVVLIAPGVTFDLKYPYTQLLVANDAGISSGKDLNKKFSAALIKSAQYTNAHRPETAAMMAEFTGIPSRCTRRWLSVRRMGQPCAQPTCSR